MGPFRKLINSKHHNNVNIIMCTSILTEQSEYADLRKYLPNSGRWHVENMWFLTGFGVNRVK
jgi:hypothetical protein